MLRLHTEINGCGQQNREDQRTGDGDVVHADTGDPEPRPQPREDKEGGDEDHHEGGDVEDVPSIGDASLRLSIVDHVVGRALVPSPSQKAGVMLVRPPLDIIETE